MGWPPRSATARSALLTLALLLAPALLPGLAPHAAAGTATLLEQRLPQGLSHAAVAWTGEHAYLFGGGSAAGLQDRIVRFTPGAGAQWMGARLPAARDGASAVWDGTAAYVFGGWTGQRNTDEILRYEPAQDRVELVARLPTPRDGTSAAWDGTFAWVFGGWDGSGWLDDVVRFDPATRSVVRWTTLPFPLWQSAAVAAGSTVYVLGGYHNAGPETTSDRILRFTAQSGVELLEPRLPTATFAAGHAWSGTHVYLFGGVHHLTGGQRAIVRFDPANLTVERMGAQLPSLRFGTMGVWADRGYALGGTFFRFGDVWFDEIVAYDPPVPPPPNDPPVAVIAPVAPAECEQGGAWVELDGSASFDPEGAALRYTWTAPGVSFKDPALPRAQGRFPLGTTTATLEVSDGKLLGRATVAVEVRDTLPPVSAASLAGLAGDAGWWRSQVNVSIVASDLCGPATPWHRVDAGPWTAGSPARVAGDGRHAVQHRAVDAQGHQEAPRSLEVRIDATPPSLDLLEPAPETVYVFEADVLSPFADPIVVGDKEVRTRASDATSGVARVTLHVDGAHRGVAAAEPHHIPWAASREGPGFHDLVVVARDVAGNQASRGLEVVTVPTTLVGLTAAQCRFLAGPSVCRFVPPLPPVPAELPDEGAALAAARAAVREAYLGVPAIPVCVDDACVLVPPRPLPVCVDEACVMVP